MQELTHLCLYKLIQSILETLVRFLNICSLIYERATAAIFSFYFLCELVTILFIL